MISKPKMEELAELARIAVPWLVFDLQAKKKELKSHS